MSDQNPPSSSTPGEPPTPDEESTPVAEETPGEEPTPVAEESADAPPPPPEEETSGRGRVIGIVAVAAVLVLVIVGLGAYFLLRTKDHKITTPGTAASMKRDSASEKELSTQLDQAKEQFRTQGKGAGISYVKSAVYKQTDSKRGPAGSLVFLGAKLSKDQSPAKWVSDKFTKQAKSNGLKITKIDPGDDDTRAVCASVATPQKVAICAWATHDTIGELVPTVPGYDATSLSKIMLDLRKDVESDQ